MIKQEDKNFQSDPIKKLQEQYISTIIEMGELQSEKFRIEEILVEIDTKIKECYNDLKLFKEKEKELL